MNIAVLFFFIHNVIATVLIGSIFAKKSDAVSKYFGYGLLLDAVAFAAWTVCIISPANLATFVTVGAVFFLFSLLAFLRAGTDSSSDGMRTLALIIGTLGVISIFIVGRYVFPTPKMISSDGFLFFNLHPFVQMIYIFALSLAAFPVIEKIAAKFKNGYACLMRYGLIIQTAAGIILIVCTEPFTLLVTGWVIGITYFALWTTLLMRKDIWLN